MPHALKLAAAVLLLATGCTTTTTTTPPPPDLRTSVVDFGGFGPFRIGMTLSQVRQANTGMLKETALANGCTAFVDRGSTSAIGSAFQLLVTPDNGGTLTGIRAPIVARTAGGIGIGSTHTDIERAYSGYPLTDVESQTGQVALVQKPGTDAYLSFAFDGASVSNTAIGTHDFAAGYELCSG